MCEKKKKKKDEPKRYEILETGTSKFLQGSFGTKKKEFKIQWKGDEWIFETKTEEECSVWVTFLQQLKN